jgi:hypothetical protein
MSRRRIQPKKMGAVKLRFERQHKYLGFFAGR